MALFNQSDKATLRLVKTLTRLLEMDLDACALNGQAVMQFARDCKTYGLWEASLYAIGYINKGFYTEKVYNVVVKACQTELKKGGKKS